MHDLIKIPRVSSFSFFMCDCFLAMGGTSSKIEVTDRIKICKRVTLVDARQQWKRLIKAKPEVSHSPVFNTTPVSRNFVFRKFTARYSGMTEYVFGVSLLPHETSGNAGTILLELLSRKWHMNGTDDDEKAVIGLSKPQYELLFQSIL
jgi:hypothetical protein